ncbi:hypothetical protein SISNIDRAFT_452874 [Sistotremastrum niveocremeum HHB9708]|uniref:Cytochrome c oxidase assembly protein n=2 Tax=Sistotremastraceae TaxID=3402574 RepID=A0A164W5S3_9AGAM|nr:hypothetical protein SISNIDRAFT_452874 [Sistotremastrum niveocremeum HHB9708]KZT41712.1 hypothetical protein SISSUDRAFT_1000351 [Sistotremastrum suecicum HHB10207 ss-3]
MSRTAKVTLVASMLFCGVTVWGVHYLQNWERETMYQGVIRDDARRAEKLKKREEELRESARKQSVYESVQKVQTSSP